MPKLKPTPLAKNCEVIRNNITLLAAAHSLRTDREIAKRIGITASTYCDRRHNPQNWTVEQLVMVAVAFRTTVPWLVTEHNLTEEVS